MRRQRQAESDGHKEERSDTSHFEEVAKKADGAGKSTSYFGRSLYKNIDEGEVSNEHPADLGDKQNHIDEPDDKADDQEASANDETDNVVEGSAEQLNQSQPFFEQLNNNLDGMNSAQIDTKDTDLSKVPDALLTQQVNGDADLNNNESPLKDQDVNKEVDPPKELETHNQFSGMYFSPIG